MSKLERIYRLDPAESIGAYVGQLEFENERLATKWIEKWHENWDAKRTMVLIKCSDAREEDPIPTGTIHLSLIAASGRFDHFNRLLHNPHVGKIAVVSHFAGGSTFRDEPIEKLEGCGGLRVKGKQILENVKAEKVNGAGEYVFHNVYHSDPVVQAALSAENVAMITDKKPILAATQDHLTKEVYPFGVFMGLDDDIHRLMPKGLSEKVYDRRFYPRELYKSGIPVLRNQEFLDPFSCFLRASAQRVKDFDEMLKDKKHYPNLERLQKVQNPNTLLITTEIVPAQVRYPRSFGLPGSVFEILIPRDPNDTTQDTTMKYLDLAIKQAEYPVGHAVSAKRRGKSSDDFYKLNRILVEAKDIMRAREMAAILKDEEFVKEWLDNENHHIVVAGVNNGYLEELKIAA